MTEKELKELIGLCITDAIKRCENNGFKVEVWPKEAIIANRFSPKTIRLWHQNGIVVSSNTCSPWDIVPE